MAKVRRGTRSMEQPNLCFTTKGHEGGKGTRHRIWVLDAHEHLHTGQSPIKDCYGPGVVHEALDPWGCRTTEMYVNSQHLWGWIQRLLEGAPFVESIDPATPTDHAIQENRGDMDVCGRFPLAK